MIEIAGGDFGQRVLHIRIHCDEIGLYPLRGKSSAFSIVACALQSP